jgi:hypothetical protein
MLTFLYRIIMCSRPSRHRPYLQVLGRLAAIANAVDCGDGNLGVGAPFEAPAVMVRGRGGSLNSRTDALGTWRGFWLLMFQARWRASGADLGCNSIAANMPSSTVEPVKLC